jgi:Heterokaryon incompatibility protein (HET)
MDPLEAIKREPRLEPLKSDAPSNAKRELDSSDDEAHTRKRRIILKEPLVYNSLRPINDEIRLFVLEPSTDRATDIRGKIIHVTLNDVLHFEALSYTWGKANDKAERPISIQGYDVAISRNLDLALRALRYQLNSRTLWIDALCINQQSNKERSRQVSLMRRIYGLVESTVWQRRQLSG